MERNTAGLETCRGVWWSRRAFTRGKIKTGLFCQEKIVKVKLYWKSFERITILQNCTHQHFLCIPGMQSWHQYSLGRPRVYLYLLWQNQLWEFLFFQKYKLLSCTLAMKRLWGRRRRKAVRLMLIFFNGSIWKTKTDLSIFYRREGTKKETMLNISIICSVYLIRHFELQVTCKEPLGTTAVSVLSHYGALYVPLSGSQERNTEA